MIKLIKKFDNIHPSNLFIHFYNLLSFLDWVYSVAFSPDGKYLATGSRDNTVSIIDMNQKSLLKKFDDLHTGNY